MHDRWLPHDWFPQPLPANVVLGERSWLHSSYAFRHYRSQRPVGVQVGHDTGIYKGTFFDLGPDGELTIGDYCSVVGAVICSNRRIETGSYVLIAHEVILADSFAAVPFDAPIVGTEAESASIAHPSVSIRIGDNVWIGARAIVLGGADIGEGSIVGAGAVVDFAVPPFSIVAGNPARIVGPARRK